MVAVGEGGEDEDQEDGIAWPQCAVQLFNDDCSSDSQGECMQFESEETADIDICREVRVNHQTRCPPLAASAARRIVMAAAAAAAQRAAGVSPEIVANRAAVAFRKAIKST